MRETDSSVLSGLSVGVRRYGDWSPRAGLDPPGGVPLRVWAAFVGIRGPKVLSEAAAGAELIGMRLPRPPVAEERPSGASVA